MSLPAWAWNCLLVVFSLAAGLAACEAALRLADTRYEQAAEPPVRAYHWPNTRPHPDANTEHEVLYNRFGNRQHRDFSESDLRDGINVAFFGDSFTEGLEVPVQYAFVEVLDHLLNARRGGGVARAFAPHVGAHVHNFGVNGTGPGSQYLRYRGFPHKARLRHVFYVHHSNDFGDLRHTGLYALNAAGELVRRMRRTPVWVRLLSGFRLTYLALDVWKRLTGADHAVDTREAVPDGDAVFEALLTRWRDEAEANGSAFHVVLLPEPGTTALFHRRVRSGSFDVLDLGGCFEDEIAGYVWKDWHFQSDTHWNEAGHMVAAHCLYRFLESRWGLARAPDEALAQARHDYYRAFADDAGWSGHRFMPSAPWALPSPEPPDRGEAARIRAKHLALRAEGEGQRRRIVREVRQGEPLARAEGAEGEAGKAGWAVYASPRHRMVVYVKSPCGKGGNDPAGRLFLHALVPEERFVKRPVAPSRRFITQSGPLDVTSSRHFPGTGRTQRDWTELRIEGTAAFWREGRECVVARSVGRQLRWWHWDGRHISLYKLRAGEWRGRPGGAVLWQVEFPFDSGEREAAATAAYRREYEAFAERPPRARPLGNWSAHVLDRSMGFLKDSCDAAELRGSFFLRMYPADPILSGLSRNLNPWFTVVRIDGKCLLWAPLPPWAVATVSAGRREDEAVLWEATFHLDVERHRRAWAAVRSRTPTAHGPFDIHRRGAELVYVRDPCAERDVAARFFLHVFTGAERSTLDFDFKQRGVLTDGRCVALAPLPEQDIDRIRTGQFVVGEGELWSVEL